jgi:hypothetical protein
MDPGWKLSWRGGVPATAHRDWGGHCHSTSDPWQSSPNRWRTSKAHNKKLTFSRVTLSSPVAPSLFHFSFLILWQLIKLLGRGISPSQACYLQKTTKKNRLHVDKYPCFELGFEPTIPVFERAKTVHALDRAAAEIGSRVTQREILGMRFQTVSKHVHIALIVTAAVHIGTCTK